MYKVIDYTWVDFESGCVHRHNDRWWEHMDVVTIWVQPPAWPTNAPTTADDMTQADERTIVWMKGKGNG